MKTRQITFLFIFLLAMYLTISAAAAASFSDLDTAINSDESTTIVYLNENNTYNADSDSEYAISPGPETQEEDSTPDTFEIVIIVGILLIITFILSQIYRKRTMKKTETEENDKPDDK